jgi:hypothetical protein
MMNYITVIQNSFNKGSRNQIKNEIFEMRLQ